VITVQKTHSDLKLLPITKPTAIKNAAIHNQCFSITSWFSLLIAKNLQRLSEYDSLISPMPFMMLK